MSITDPTYKADLEARLAAKRAQLLATQAAILELIPQNIEEYKLDTGEMEQRARRRKVKELQELQESLESEIDSIYRRLNGGALVSMNLRRKR